jgi:hypothetical protein
MPVLAARWCLILALLTCGVAALRGPPALAARPIADVKFPSRYPIVLGLDLRDDLHPKARLIVTHAWSPKPTDVNIALPFAVNGESANEKAAMRIGKYDGWTMVSFWGGGASWPQEIAFQPEVSRPESVEEIGDTDAGLSLISAGQERRFYYRYPTSSFLQRPTDDAPAGLTLQTTDAVAIELPQGAKQFAVKKGRLSIPTQLDGDDLAFAGLAPSTDVKFIEIAYLAPPTDFQKTVVKWGVKLLTAILPLVGLAFVSRDQIIRPRWRWAMAGIGAALFGGALGLILWAAPRSSSAEEVYWDLFLLLTTTAVAAALAFVKVKSPAPANPAP